ncbi:MAG: hypothetical protein WCO63_13860 [Bacteroidota bacterium]
MKTMKHLSVLVLLFSCLLIGNKAFAQYGFGTNNPSPSAVVEMSSATKGLLIPRIALTAVNSPLPVTSPANSLLVYNTANAGISPNDVTPGYYYWDQTNSKWIRFATKGSVLFSEIQGGTNTSAAMLVGAGASLAPTSTGTITANQFVGTGSTTNAVDLGTAEVAGALPIGNIAHGTLNTFLITKADGVTTAWQGLSVNSTIISGDGITTPLDIVSGSLGNSLLTNSTMTFTSTSGSLLAPGVVSLGGTGNYDLNLAHANTWVGQQIFTTALPQTPLAPVVGNDLTNKTYVDSQISGLQSTTNGEPFITWTASPTLTNENVATGGAALGITNTAGLATFDVKFDNSTINLNGSNQLRVKPDGITTLELANDAVETANIKDANVTTSKILDGNVTYLKIQDASTSNRLLISNASNKWVETDAANLSAIGNIKTINANYTAVTSDGTLLADASTGNVVVTLPAAGSSLGVKLSIKKKDNGVNSVTLDPNASETIEGLTTKTWDIPWQGFVIQCDGTSWFVVSMF